MPTIYTATRVLPPAPTAAQPPEPQEAKPTKVFIAVPTIGLVDIRWSFRMHEVLLHVPPGTAFATDWNYGIAETREYLADAALGLPEVTHVLFIDSDVLPPVDIVTRLLEDNVPIVAGIYFNSLFNGLSAWVNGRVIDIQQDAPLVQVDKVGLGCCLIRREVFDSIKERPWFYYRIGHNYDVLSEDFHFFNMAEKHGGFKPFVDMRIQCTHIKRMMIDSNGRNV